MPKNPHEKAIQRALMQYKNPANRELVLEGLRMTGRMDLVGYGPKCLIRPIRENSNNGGSGRNGNNSRSGNGNRNGNNGQNGNNRRSGGGGSNGNDKRNGNQKKNTIRNTHKKNTRGGRK